MTHALEGGLAGATALNLLHEAIDKIGPKAVKPRLLHSPGTLKKIKKYSHRKGPKPLKFYIRLATEFLASMGYFGLPGFGKKKNALLIGGLLGAAAGFGVAFLNQPDDAAGTGKAEGTNKDEIWNKLATMALYTAGGLVAGGVVKKLKKKRK